MASSPIQLNVTLPLLPKGYKEPTCSSLSAPSTSTLYPAGPAFVAHARRVLQQRTFEEDDKLQHEAFLANGGGIGEEEDDTDGGLGDEKEDKSLLLSDPKLWKAQDHYAVLGLQDLRHAATDEQIKKAHRRKVLRHHPDKKASAGGEANDDSFFKCIAKAMEVVSNPEKRRQFDSVDSAIDDDDVPEAKETTPENFFDLWAPVFVREGRFSKAQPVPVLGDMNSERKAVESFYDFFYNIDSWRSFEYLDKDSPEGTDSRDEKRHQEKKNKSDRAQKKKEDNARVRSLIDLALSLDPRIRKFKADEKAARDAKKRGGPVVVVDEAQKAAEEAAKKAEEERIAKEEAAKNADDKTSREAAKKAKLAAAKNVKKDRKAISTLVTANNYFVATGTSPSPAVVEGQLSELDLLFSALEPEQVGEFKTEAEAAKGASNIKAVVVKWAGVAGEKLGAGKFKEFA